MTMSNSLNKDRGYNVQQEPKDENDKFLDKHIHQIVRRRVGRPRMWHSPETLAAKALEYFDWCIQTKNKITFSGLRLFVDMSRQNWADYKNKHEEFLDTINTIETALESEWEGKLGWAGSTQGAIFWLKNKAGWMDEVVQNVKQVTEVKPEIHSTGEGLSNKEG